MTQLFVSSNELNSSAFELKTKSGRIAIYYGWPTKIESTWVQSWPKVEPKWSLSLLYSSSKCHTTSAETFLLTTIQVCSFPTFTKQVTTKASCLKKFPTSRRVARPEVGRAPTTKARILLLAFNFLRFSTSSSSPMCCIIMHQKFSLV